MATLTSRVFNNGNSQAVRKRPPTSPSFLT